MTREQELLKIQSKLIGDIKPNRFITPLIPKGTTILYGRSGCGKTYSLLKHLQSNKIKPYLLAFDDNPALDFDYVHFNGAFFVENYKDNEYTRKLREVDKYLEKRIKQFDFSEYEEDKMQCLRYAVNGNYETNEKDKEVANIDLEDLINKAYNIDDPITNEVIIIDTYAKALEYFGNVEALRSFTDDLLSNGNDIIIIAHTTGERDKDLDMDSFYANHCDGRLKLHRDITKTKGAETYLFIEKLRGYFGDNIILEWEREK